jgi:hypothetical protein
MGVRWICEQRSAGTLALTQQGAYRGRAGGAVDFIGKETFKKRASKGAI